MQDLLLFSAQLSGWMRTVKSMESYFLGISFLLKTFLDTLARQNMIKFESSQLDPMEERHNEIAEGILSMS